MHGKVDIVQFGPKTCCIMYVHTYNLNNTTRPALHEISRKEVGGERHTRECFVSQGLFICRILLCTFSYAFLLFYVQFFYAAVIPFTSNVSSASSCPPPPAAWSVGKYGGKFAHLFTRVVANLEASNPRAVCCFVAKFSAQNPRKEPRNCANLSSIEK